MAKKTDEELYDVAICGSNSPIRNISMRFWSMVHSMYIWWSRCVGKRME